MSMLLSYTDQVLSVNFSLYLGSELGALFGSSCHLELYLSPEGLSSPSFCFKSE